MIYHLGRDGERERIVLRSLPLDARRPISGIE
jgi:hypothetical protein